MSGGNSRMFSPGIGSTCGWKMCWLLPGSGSPDSRWTTASVVMQAPMPTAMDSTISAVSTLLRRRLRAASCR
jgi:hypothetical protein